MSPPTTAARWEIHLLNLVAGLETPTEGEIRIDGEPIAGLSEDELAVTRRRHVEIVTSSSTCSMCRSKIP